MPKSPKTKTVARAASETLGVFLFEPTEFRDRQAVRDFVRGDRFDLYMFAAQAGCESGPPKARHAALWLIQALSPLAIAAAGSDRTPLEIVHSGSVPDCDENVIECFRALAAFIAQQGEFLEASHAVYDLAAELGIRAAREAA